MSISVDLTNALIPPEYPYRRTQPASPWRISTEPGSHAERRRAPAGAEARRRSRSWPRTSSSVSCAWLSPPWTSRRSTPTATNSWQPSPATWRASCEKIGLRLDQRQRHRHQRRVRATSTPWARRPPPRPSTTPSSQVAENVTETAPSVRPTPTATSESSVSKAAANATAIQGENKSKAKIAHVQRHPSRAGGRGPAIGPPPPRRSNEAAKALEAGLHRPSRRQRLPVPARELATLAGRHHRERPRLKREQMELEAEAEAETNPPAGTAARRTPSLPRWRRRAAARRRF